MYREKSAQRKKKGKRTHTHTQKLLPYGKSMFGDLVCVCVCVQRVAATKTFGWIAQDTATSSTPPLSSASSDYDVGAASTSKHKLTIYEEKTHFAPT